MAQIDDYKSELARLEAAYAKGPTMKTRSDGSQMAYYEGVFGIPIEKQISALKGNIANVEAGQRKDAAENARRTAQMAEHARTNSPEAAALLQANPSAYVQKFGSPTDVANLPQTLATSVPKPETIDPNSLRANASGLGATSNPLGGATGFVPPQPTSIIANSNGIAPTINPQVGGASGYAPTQNVSQGTSLNISSNLTRGSRGKEVEELQKALNASGIGVNLKVDGDFGPATEAAVRAYQQVNNLRVDGVVGQQTRGQLQGTPTPISSVLQAMDESVQNNPQLKALEDAVATIPELKATIDALRLSITSKVEQGQKVNPDLQITPEMTARFLEEATNELDPYYKELINQQKQDLSVSFRQLQEDYNKNIAREQPTFEQTLENQDIAEANQGTAFSSGRIDRERSLIAGQQERLDDYFTANQRKVEDLARVGERKIGSRAFTDLGIPSLQSFAAGRTISPRGSIAPTGSRTLYQPSGDLFGELPAQRKTAISTRGSALEEAEIKKRILDQGGLGQTSIG